MGKIDDHLQRCLQNNPAIRTQSIRLRLPRRNELIHIQTASDKGKRIAVETTTSDRDEWIVVGTAFKGIRMRWR